MTDLEQGTVNVQLNPSTSVPKTEFSKTFLKNTSIPRVTKWIKGVPTPIQEGDMSPNQQAFSLIKGFASGEITMAGDEIHHLLTTPDGNTISESLNELPWSTPERSKITDGSVNRNKKPKIAQKEPHKIHAKQLAELNSHTKVPDADIKVENIIPGSPAFIPYQQKTPINESKGSKGPKIKFFSESTDMAHIRRMLMKAKMAAIEVRNKRADKHVKRMAEEAVKQARENAKLKAKATRKSASSGTKPTKPRHSWEMHAL